ncbi:MAG TPA: xanthine dehydrogenase, partial [Spirochaetales bacterium]|nr:xanthine dehydrogenase [Spirochaetales bacterium]
LERTLFHAAGSYFIPNVKATGISCRTTLPPNTAFRGFGAPQAMFVMEAAIFKAAAAMGKDPSEIQKLNLLKNGDYFHYGMKVEHCQAESCWQETEKRYKSNKIKQEIRAFNRENRLVKKGMAFMPICFGISFTTIFLNQANALVHLYTDGSVSISTGAVEMGQRVNAKILQVASEIFSISPERIKIESTNTTRAANTSPTAASTGADLNGKATEFACRIILERLRRTAAAEQGHNDPGRITIEQEQVLDTGKRTDLDWEKLITIAYLKRVSLSAQAHYATPDIHFDKKKEKGLPFAYMVYGTAIIEVTLDCLRGIYQVDSVKVVHDFGRSLNPLIDLGQAEGAIVQGIGWLTLEELFYSDQGRLLTDSLTNYKVPDIHYTPREITIHFLENLNNPLGIFNSKAVGEPPFMYGIAVYWALIEAMQSFRPDIEIPYNSPLTPEKVLLTLYKKE